MELNRYPKAELMKINASDQINICRAMADGAKAGPYTRETKSSPNTVVPTPIGMAIAIRYLKDRSYMNPKYWSEET